jgi:hypothetical protein
MARRWPGNRGNSLLPAFEAAVRECRRSFVCILFTMAALLPYSFAANQPNVAEIIRQSTEANDRDWSAITKFDNYERDHDKDGDKTYAVTMLYGTPYSRLIAINGHTLGASQQKEQQEKYETAVAQRKNESPEERSKRIAKYDADLKRDHTMLAQMTRAFDFRLIGQRNVNGYRVYVLKATPRQGYKPIDRDSEVLPGMEGTLWIDQKTYQWVKVEAHVIHPVRIEGFLAEVEPGTSFEVEKRPVSGNIWQISHYAMKANAKIMFVFRHRGQEDDSYYDYRPAANDQSAK